MLALLEMLHAYRNVVYVLIKPGWLSVRIVRDDKRLGQFEDVPQIAIRKKRDARYEVVAVGREAEQVVGDWNGVSLCRGFDHPRVVIGNFEEAERVLGDFVRRAYGGKYPLLACRMLLHPLPLREGGLSDLEERGLMELGRSIGAREAFACQLPRELSDAELAYFTQWRLPEPEEIVRSRLLH